MIRVSRGTGRKTAELGGQWDVLELEFGRSSISRHKSLRTVQVFMDGWVGMQHDPQDNRTSESGLGSCGGSVQAQLTITGGRLYERRYKREAARANDCRRTQARGEVEDQEMAGYTGREKRPGGERRRQDGIVLCRNEPEPGLRPAAGIITTTGD
ncbi:hypothetical protein AUP68_10729 [Ilyonectria robusta]